MKTVNISYTELLDIYTANGHQVKQPNSVKAICEALNTMSSKMVEVVWERLDAQNQAIYELVKQVAELRAALGTQVKAAARSMSGRECYCGTRHNESACPVCHAKS